MPVLSLSLTVCQSSSTNTCSLRVILPQPRLAVDPRGRSWGWTVLLARHGRQVLSAVDRDFASGIATAGQLPSPQLRVRSATVGDLPSIAHLFGQTFASVGARQGFAEEEEESAAVQLLRRAEGQYATAIEREMNTLLLYSLQQKSKKSAESRDYRAWRRLQQLNAEIASLRGERFSISTPVTPVERRQLDSWRRARTFAVLIAEDAATHRIAGAATVSLTPAEALLPPPFPTRAKARLYVGNMAVASTDRRRGVASKLLAACETLGRRWGYSSIWLHFDRGNDAAEALYVGRGFNIVSVAPDWRIWPKRRSLLCKQLTPVAPWPTSNTNVSGTVRADDGVFVWEEAIQEEL